MIWGAERIAALVSIFILVRSRVSLELGFARLWFSISTARGAYLLRFI